MPKKKSPVLEEEIQEPETTEAEETKAPKVEKTKKETKVQEPEVGEKKVMTSDQEREALEAKARKEIEAAPKISYVVPLDPGEKPGAVQVVSLNGYALTIKKGVRVNIPLPMAEILDEKYKVESEAGADMRDDNWDEKKLDRIG